MIVRRRGDGSNRSANTVGCRFIRDDRILRQVMRNHLADAKLIQFRRRQIGPLQGRDVGGRGRRTDRLRNCVQRGGAIFMRLGEIEDFASLRRAPARLAGIGEERHRRLRTNQNQLLKAAKEFHDLFGEIGNTLHTHAPGAALQPRGEGIAQQTATAFRRNAPGGMKPRRFQGRAADQDRGFPSRLQRGGDTAHRSIGHRGGGWHRQRGRRPFRLQPGGIGRQDERCDLARRLQRGAHGPRAIGRNGFGRGGRMHPARHGARKPHDIGSERRIILCMIGGVIADDVDQRCCGAACIVQIGPAIAEARPQMQQRAGRFFRHAAITIGHAGGSAFKQGQHRADTVNAIERRDEVHFRRAGIGETDFDTGAG